MEKAKLDEILKKGEDLYNKEKRYVKAFPFLKEAYENGALEAAFDLAQCYINGEGTEPSAIEAIKVLSSLPKKSDNDASLFYYCQIRSKLNSTTKKDSLKKLKTLSKRNELANKLLGYCYRYGFFVTKSYKIAESYFRKSGENSDSVFALGSVLLFENHYSEAFQKIKKAYEIGKGYNCGYFLAECYYHGWGTTVDESMSFKIMSEASRGNDDALESLGAFYYYGEGVKQNYSKAFNIFRKLASKSEDAKFFLGKCYYFGNGVKKNYSKAFDLLSNLQEKNTTAKLLLGNCYYYGLGVTRNYKAAKTMYESCKNNFQAKEKLAIIFIVEKKYKKGYKILRSLQHNSKVQSSAVVRWLSLCYINGFGTKKNIKKGVNLLKKSAKIFKNGYFFYQLGEMYEHGIYVKRNNAKAYQCYKKADCQIGYSNVARCMAVGIGTKPKPKKALEYLKGIIANEGKDPELMAQLAAMLCEPKYREAGIKPNPPLALKLAKLASNEGNGRAFFILGEMYSDGVETKKSKELATECFKKSGELGFSNFGESPSLQLADMEAKKHDPNIDCVLRNVEMAMDDINHENKQCFEDITKKITKRNVKMRPDQILQLQKAQMKFLLLKELDFQRTAKMDENINILEKESKQAIDTYFVGLSEERRSFKEKMEKAMKDGATNEEIERILNDYIDEADALAKKVAKSQRFIDKYNANKTKFENIFEVKGIELPDTAMDSFYSGLTLVSALKEGLLPEIKDLSGIYAPFTKALEEELFTLFGEPYHQKLAQLHALGSINQATKRVVNEEYWPYPFRNDFPDLSIGEYVQALNEKTNKSISYEEDVPPMFSFGKNGYSSMEEMVKCLGEIKDLRNITDHKDPLYKDRAKKLEELLLGPNEDGFFFRFPLTIKNRLSFDKQS
jgi:TPR repeat protein